jgi:O-antigen/teichoic acid export membrane protein
MYSSSSKHAATAVRSSQPAEPVENASVAILEPAGPSEDETPSPASDVMGDELKKLVRHSSHYLAGLIGGFAIGLISFPIFTRVFTVAEYGVIDLVQKIVAMLVIGSKLGLQNAALRFYQHDKFKTDPSAARTYYSTIFLGTLGNSAGIAVLFVAAVALTSGALVGGIGIWAGCALALLAVARALASIVWAFLRTEERTTLFNVTVVGTRALTVAIICTLLIWMRRSVDTYIGGMLAVEGAVVLALAFFLLRRGVLSFSSFDTQLFRSGVAYGMPLVIYELAFTVLGSADRFLVRHYLGNNALGLYSVAYGLAQHANELLVVPLVLAVTPMYMRIWTTQGAAATSRFLTVALEVSIIVAGALLATLTSCARDVVVLLASSKYAGIEYLIPIFLCGLLVFAAHVFMAAGLLIYKRTVLMAGLLAAAAALNIGLNCLMLPTMGLLGGALATCISYLVCIVLLRRWSSRLLPLALDAKLVAKCIAIGSAAFLGTFQIHFDSTVANLLVKSGLTISIYFSVLYLFDRRVRRASALASRRWFGFPVMDRA